MRVVSRFFFLPRRLLQTLIAVNPALFSAGCFKNFFVFMVSLMSLLPEVQTFPGVECAPLHKDVFFVFPSLPQGVALSPA